MNDFKLLNTYRNFKEDSLSETRLELACICYKVMGRFNTRKINMF